MMESVVISAVVGFMAARGGSFLDKMTERTADEIGKDILTSYQRWKAGRVAETDAAAQQLLAAAGLQRMPVPGRILFPLLDYASVEEDDELRAKWAALLANAGSPGPENRILPGYVEILRQLIPVQVKVLDWIYEKFPGIDVAGPLVCQQFNLTAEDYALFASDLHRLQLVDGRRTVPSVPMMGHGMSGSLHGSTPAGWTSTSHYAVIALTPLGIGFIQACRPPAPKEV